MANGFRRAAILAVTVLLFMSPSAALAQVGASLGGFVSDETGASLARGDGHDYQHSNGTTQVLVTGADGNYPRDRAVAGAVSAQSGIERFRDRRRGR